MQHRSIWDACVTYMWICLFKVCVCVCVCLSSLCNETPEVSEGHSGAAEERTGAGTGGVPALLCAFSNCRAVFQTVAPGKFTAGQEKEFSSFGAGGMWGGVWPARVALMCL